MKVGRESEPFRRVTITIESKEEFIALTSFLRNSGLSERDAGDPVSVEGLYLVMELLAALGKE